jgi:4-amino-4-deoxy-L-arabinose transferase-like glycosyltransferase
MVALMIRLFTANLFFHYEFFIRLGSICCAAAGTWLIFRIGIRIGNEYTGWIAAILYNSSFYCSIIAGTFILPDSPQVICWLLSIYFMIRILEYSPGEKQPALNFILLSISSGYV